MVGVRVSAKWCRHSFDRLGGARATSGQRNSPEPVANGRNVYSATRHIALGCNALGLSAMGVESLSAISGLRRLDQRASILRDARSAALLVEIPTHLLSQRWSRDPDDDVFIRTALAANASWLVTGSEDLLTIPIIDGINVMPPAKALGALGPD